MRNSKSTASREIRQRNEQFSTKARTGKNPINASRKEKLCASRYLSCRTVLTPLPSTVFFEAIRLVFL
ncbi:hypothetical protein EDB83DRAFT_2352658 [Lactarius deliciosus]|nr:hypothetical protein EDB83DRAFT_2352658 [Lactarius deliciosus]